MAIYVGHPTGYRTHSRKHFRRVIVTGKRPAKIFGAEFNLSIIESGLKANAEYQLEEYPTDVGLIDLLCQDAAGRWVVIELKAGLAGDAAIGQILGYIAWVRENLPKGENARGILVCKKPHPRVLAVAKMFPDISVKSFQLSFSIEDA
jgi:hypothetical protein